MATGSKRKRDAKKDKNPLRPPVYLVVEHKANDPAYSILKVDAAGTTKTPLRGSHRGMSFAAVESRWIIGVGGKLCRPTTIYDLTTSVESRGPWLDGKKMEPVLIPLRGYLYVLSRRPSVRDDRENLDFLPWFERICCKRDTPYRMSCQELPPPPIFPCRINPIEYLHPPDVRVAAYAAVGSHILISVSVSVQQQEQQQDKGTCAFDVDRGVWEMVHDRNLPFLGQAVPLGNHLFIARSKEKDGTAAVYFMVVCPAKDTDSGKSELSILELPLVVPKGRVVPGQLLCASGNDSFSSFELPDAKLDCAPVIHRTYSIAKGDDTGNNVVLVKKQRQVFKLPRRSLIVAHPTPVVAAFTMQVSQPSSFTPAPASSALATPFFPLPMLP